MVKREKKPFSLIIIGGGPAGLTAGIYAKRAKIDTLLIEKAILGGLITSTELVENYPGFPQGISGMDLGRNFEDQAKKYGLDIIYGKVVKIEVKGKIKEVHTEEHSYSSKAVIIASGSEPQKLGVPGEKALTGKGISYCATCDGPFYKDKNVAVVGGGNAALEEAIFLTRFAKLVTIIHRRDDLRADKVLQEKAAANPKIFLKLSTIVEEIVGDKKVQSIKVKDVKTNKTSSMDIDGVFLYVGLKPNTDFLKGLVDLDKNGNIITDDKLATNIEGIFAAGDVRKKHLRQVVTSTADGAIAAHGAKEYLESEGFSLF
ncbi:thioredoxin-disulfide reductase [Candidatus Margulisiibacteriota bacterium]